MNNTNFDEDLADGSITATAFPIGSPIPVDFDAIRDLFFERFDVDHLEGFANSVDIIVEDDARNALSMALQARKLNQAISESRAQIVKPHFDYQKSINKLVGDVKDKLVSIEKMLQVKIEAWMHEQKSNPFTAINELRVEDGSISVKNIMTFQVIDDSIVPMDFFSVDEEKIKKAVDRGVKNIPGIKIDSTETTTLRVKN